MRLFIDTKSLDKALNNIAMAVRVHIIDSTSKGRDMNGQPFKRYSEAYLAVKQRYQKGKGSGSLVNLTRTGKMLNAIARKKSGNGYDVYFTEKAMALRASYHHFGDGQPKRAFFGVSPEVETRLFKKYMVPIGRIDK